MLNIYEEICQGSEEWHALRDRSIGTSDASVIMGINPWKTPYQLWEEKQGIRHTVQNEAMKRGIILEGAARFRLQELFGIEFNPAVCFHHEFPWLIASLDCLSIDHKYIVEIKCPGKEDHGKSIKGNIPDYYYPQLQHQMLVTGHDAAFYYSFDGIDGIIIPCKRDDKFIEKMLDSEKDFYQCMISGTPPPLTDKDVIRRDDNEWVDIVESWKESKFALEQAEKKEKYFRDKLISMAQNKNTEGAGCRVTKVIRRGTIDYSSIPQLIGIDLEPYRKNTTITWRIT